MSHVEDEDHGGGSPTSLKRKRELEEYSSHRVSPGPFKAPKLTNGLSSAASSTLLNGQSHSASDAGDMLQAVASASSHTSTSSSVFSNTSRFAANHRASLGNGDSPLTILTDSSPPKTSSPRTASTIPRQNTAALPRPPIFPAKGSAKGYRAVWDPELDGKLSKEERKRATVKRREFGLEVRCIFHILLSLRNITYLILS